MQGQKILFEPVDQNNEGCKVCPHCTDVRGLVSVVTASEVIVFCLFRKGPDMALAFIQGIVIVSPGFMATFCSIPDVFFF